MHDTGVADVLQLMVPKPASSVGHVTIFKSEVFLFKEFCWSGE